MRPATALPILPALACMAAAQPARAEVPPAVKAMIEAAIASGDERKVQTVIDLARGALPDDKAELDALLGAFQAGRRELAAAEAARKQQELEQAGILDGWSAKGQLGAFQSSGNARNVGVSLALNLERRGVDWQHLLRGNIDYQRSNGVTSTERYLAAYEPRFQISPRLFSYALAQYEQNRFLGYTSRYSMSGGIGVRLMEAPGPQLSIKAGPSWRKVDYTNGNSESSLGALAGFDFDWQFAKNLTLTQDANLVADSGGAASVIIDSTSTSVLLITGIEAKVSDHLTTRLSYTLDYDSNPPFGRRSTDTLSRMTVVFGF